MPMRYGCRPLFGLREPTWLGRDMSSLDTLLSKSGLVPAAALLELGPDEVFGLGSMMGGGGTGAAAVAGILAGGGGGRGRSR